MNHNLHAEVAARIGSQIAAGVVLADPPLAFQTRAPKGEGRSPQRHYQCMPFDELVKLPVASITAADAFLFCWIPLGSVDLVKPLMEAWGFRFSGAGFTWAKTYKNGDWFMGTGHGTHHNVEVCWLGRRGNHRRKSKGIRELIVAPVREHSRKPDEIYARTEALCDGPYVELFARQCWPGWIPWGEEVNKFASPPIVNVEQRL
jgi:N6-adenosine-specific RNA methylase IME4